MRIQNSPKTTTTNQQQESQSTSEPVRTSQIQNGVASVKDSVEVFSAPKSAGYEATAETSQQQERAAGAIELTAEQLKRAGSPDVDNARQKPSERQTRSETNSYWKPEERTQSKTQNPPRSDNPLAGAPGDFNVSDKYTVPSQGGPSTLEEVKASLNQPDRLGPFTPNSGHDKLNLFSRLEENEQRRRDAKAGMANVEDGWVDKVDKAVEAVGQAAAVVASVAGATAAKAAATGGAAAAAGSVAVATGAGVVGVGAGAYLGTRALDNATGFSEILVEAVATHNETNEAQEMHDHIMFLNAKRLHEERQQKEAGGGVKDPGPLGSEERGYTGRPVLGAMGFDEYMREMKGVNTGGETVNPDPEGNGGGQSGYAIGNRFDVNTQTSGGKQYLIGQPVDSDVTPSGGGGGGAHIKGGAVDFENGSGWTGETKTEEESDVQMESTTGALDHIINNDDDDEEDDNVTNRR